MIIAVTQRMTILMGIKKNDWKKDLLVVDMFVIKHILEWREFMR